MIHNSEPTQVIVNLTVEECDRFGCAEGQVLEVKKQYRPTDGIAYAKHPVKEGRLIALLPAEYTAIV